MPVISLEVLLLYGLATSTNWRYTCCWAGHALLGHLEDPLLLKMGPHLIGTQFCPVQTEFSHRNRHANSWNSCGDHCPHQLAVSFLESEQIVQINKVVHTRGLEGQREMGLELMRRVHPPATLSRDLRGNINGIEIILLPRSRDALADDSMF